MKLEEFKKIEKNLKINNFNKSYRNINNTLFYLSIFGHTCSIFLAYFLVNGILSTVITNIWISISSTIILLVGLELLKREIFNKFSLEYLKNKFTKNIYGLFVACIIVSILSFYATVSGAKRFSSKQKEIQQTTELNINIYTDSISEVYNNRKIPYFDLIQEYREDIRSKDIEQTELEQRNWLTTQQRNRVRDLKQEKDYLRNEINKQEKIVKDIDIELLTRIEIYENRIENISSKESSENKYNILFFIILSAIIEVLIIGGVYFNEYYRWRSYTEFKRKIESDINYRNWFTLDSFIDIIYSDDTQINDKLTNINQLPSICKIHNLNLLKNDIQNLLKILTSMNILKTLGSSRYFNRSKHEAKRILKDRFKIE